MESCVPLNRRGGGMEMASHGSCVSLGKRRGEVRITLRGNRALLKQERRWDESHLP